MCLIQVVKKVIFFLTLCLQEILEEDEQIAKAAKPLASATTRKRKRAPAKPKAKAAAKTED